MLMMQPFRATGYRLNMIPEQNMLLLIDKWCYFLSDKSLQLNDGWISGHIE